MSRRRRGWEDESAAAEHRKPRPPRVVLTPRLTQMRYFVPARPYLAGPHRCQRKGRLCRYAARQGADPNPGFTYLTHTHTVRPRRRSESTRYAPSFTMLMTLLIETQALPQSPMPPSSPHATSSRTADFHAAQPSRRKDRNLLPSGQRRHVPICY